MHLYAICVDCLEGVHKIVCIKCKSRWDGSWHQLGTMYTYDILAASPCCQVRYQHWNGATGGMGEGWLDENVPLKGSRYSEI